MIRLRPLALTALVVLPGCATPDEPPVAQVLTPEPGQYWLLQYSPDGTKMAYVARREGKQAVWTASVDGRNATQLTPTSLAVDAPRWSPDGKWIAYTSDAGESADVWLVPSAGGTPKQLTSLPGSETVAGWFPDSVRVLYHSATSGLMAPYTVSVTGGAPEPLLQVKANTMAYPSPDGRRMVLEVREGPRRHLEVLTLDGMSTKPLTSEGRETFQDWSPDGREVLYYSLRTGTRDLWIATVEDGKTRQLTRDIRMEHMGRWSPDGKWVAFFADRGGQTDLWLIPASGGESTRLTNDTDHESDPRWSPDGKSLTFSRPSGEVQLWVRNLGDGTIRQVTNGPHPAVPGPISPDGTKFVFVTGEHGMETIWVAPLQGGPATRLTTNPFADRAPEWTPDGATIIYYAYDTSGRRSLWKVPAAGGKPAPLASTGGSDFNGVVSPDGAYVAFESTFESTNHDIWIAPLSGGKPTRLTRTGRNHDPRWGSDSRSVLFHSSAIGPGTAQINVVSIDGGAPRVVAVPGEPAGPSLSPRGMNVGTLFRAGSRWSIGIVGADGAGFRDLTPKAEDVFDLRWSPDAARLAFRLVTKGEEDVAVVNATTGELQVYSMAGTTEDLPHWSPDGRSILFSKFNPNVPLYRIDLAGPLSRATAR